MQLGWEGASKKESHNNRINTHTETRQEQDRATRYEEAAAAGET